MLKIVHLRIFLFIDYGVWNLFGKLTQYFKAVVLSLLCVPGDYPCTLTLHTHLLHCGAIWKAGELLGSEDGLQKIGQ